MKRAVRFFITAIIVLAAVSGLYAVNADAAGGLSIPADALLYKGNHCKAYDKNVSWASAAKSTENIADAEVTLAGTPCSYSGKEQRPEPAVTLNGKTLIAGQDYLAEYRNNTEAGTAEVIIEGTGAYSGTVSKTFAIRPADVGSCEITLSQKSALILWNKTVKVPVSVSFNGEKLKAGERTYRLEYENCDKAGTASVKVTGSGNFTGEIVLTYRLFRVFSQQDIRWRHFPYGYNDPEASLRARIGEDGKNGVGAGCCILAIVNALWYLQERDEDPTAMIEELAVFARERGYRVNGQGTIEGFVKALCTDRGSIYGIGFVGFATAIEEIKQDLIQGRVAIAHVKGHYVAVVDYDTRTDRYLVLDSSVSRNRGTAPMGYRWMAQEEFIRYMRLTISPKPLQVFEAAE